MTGVIFLRVKVTSWLLLSTAWPTEMEMPKLTKPSFRSDSLISEAYYLKRIVSF